MRAALRLERDEGHLSSAALGAVLGLARQNLREHLLALAAGGWLTYQAQPRQTALLGLTPRSRALLGGGFPLVGEVAAGQPTVAEQHIEGLVTRLEDLLDLREGDFLLRVRGESMTGLGIFPGDIVAIRPGESAVNGDLALVLVPGENTATLKRWQRRGAKVALHSENPAFEPMLYPAADVKVQGLLVGHVGRMLGRRQR